MLRLVLLLHSGCITGSSLHAQSSMRGVMPRPRLLIVLHLVLLLHSSCFTASSLFWSEHNINCQALQYRVTSQFQLLLVDSLSLCAEGAIDALHTCSHADELDAACNKRLALQLTLPATPRPCVTDFVGAHHLI
jgi:hypothetical protein